MNFLEAALVDHMAFQRLRRITQLAGAPFVYPSAVHSRFSHSLGTMYVAKLYAEALEMEPSDALVTSLCALLHDIGHGPFSHCFEDATKTTLHFDHEVMGLHIMQVMSDTLLDDCSQKLLEGLKEETLSFGFADVPSYAHWAIGEAVQALQQGDYRAHVVDGPMGADRLDFIARDAYFTGVSAFNTVDIFRLTGNALLLDGHLVFRSKVVDNIYGLTVGRFLMYKNVYYHKTSRAAELMMQLMIREALHEGALNDYLELPEFLHLDEPMLTGTVQAKGNLSKQIWDKLLRRKLWKVVEERVVKPEEQEEALSELHAIYDPCYIDIPEKLSLTSSGDYGDVLILAEESQVKTLADYERETGYSLLQEESNVFMRVYKEV